MVHNARTLHGRWRTVEQWRQGNEQVKSRITWHSKFDACASATGGAIQLFQAFGPPDGRCLPEAFRRAGDSGKAPG